MKQRLLNCCLLFLGITILLSVNLYAQQNQMVNDTLAPKNNKSAKKATPKVETIYLKNGETIKGIIREITAEYYAIESVSGFGILQVPKDDIMLITFPRNVLNLDRRIGIGYMQRKSTVKGSNNEYNYVSDQASIKSFFAPDYFAEILIGFGRTNDENDDVHEVFSTDVRLAHTFKRTHNMLMYYGGSVGYLSVKDPDKNIDDTGTRVMAFLGAEVFFNALPNFGFSGEMTLSQQSVGDVTSTELALTSFPAFSVHYYF